MPFVLSTVTNPGAATWIDSTTLKSSSEAFNEFYVDPNAPDGSVPAERIYTTVAAAVTAAEADPDCVNGYTIRLSNVGYPPTTIFTWDGTGHTGTRACRILAVGRGAAIFLDPVTTLGAGPAGIDFVNLFIGGAGGTVTCNGHFFFDSCNIWPSGYITFTAGTYFQFSNCWVRFISLEATSFIWAFGCNFEFSGDRTHMTIGANSFLEGCTVRWYTVVGGGATTLATSAAAVTFDMRATSIQIPADGNAHTYTFTGGTLTMPCSDATITAPQPAAGANAYVTTGLTNLDGLSWMCQKTRSVTNATLNPLTDTILTVNNTGGVTITLPDPTSAGIPYGKVYPIKATVAIAVGPVNDITLTPTAGLIEGAASFLFSSKAVGLASFSVYSDGTAWRVI